MEHKVEIIPAEEILANRSNAYDFIDFDKQETLHEVALEFAKDHYEMYETSNLGSMYFGFCWGAKWQQEQMYSEEDMEKAIKFGADGMYGWQMGEEGYYVNQVKRFLETFKKK